MGSTPGRRPAIKICATIAEPGGFVSICFFASVSRCRHWGSAHRGPNNSDQLFSRELCAQVWPGSKAALPQCLVNHGELRLAGQYSRPGECQKAKLKHFPYGKRMACRCSKRDDVSRIRKMISVTWLIIAPAITQRAIHANYRKRNLMKGCYPTTPR